MVIGDPEGFISTGWRCSWSVVRMKFQRMTLVASELEDNSEAGRSGRRRLYP